MKLAAVLAGALVIVACGAAPATAAERRKCLGVDERRAAVAAKKAIPLVKAVRSLRGRVRGEVVRARLCEQGKSLVYVLTVLARDGKVTRVSVDARPGVVGSGS